MRSGGSSSGQLFEMSSRMSDSSGSYCSEPIYAESASLQGSIPIDVNIVTDPENEMKAGREKNDDTPAEKQEGSIYVIDAKL